MPTMYWVNYAWILKNHIFFITCVSPSTLECKLLESWRPAYTVSGHSLTHVEHCLAKVTAQQTLGEWTECALSHWLSAKDSACNAEDAGSIPGLGRSLEEGMAAHSSVLAWRIPWTEEPVGYSPGVTHSQTQQRDQAQHIQTDTERLTTVFKR